MIPRRRALASLLFPGLCCAVVAAVANPIAFAADQPQPLASALERIHQCAVDDAWRKAGWKDAALETWLDGLAETIAKAAEMPELKLPVRFADVKPGDPADPRDDTLIVGRDLRLPKARLSGCILLADGNVELASAEGCLIVARGAVAIERSAFCVIVAGAYVHLDFDGNPRDTINGSLLVTRGRADVGTARGSVVLAPEGTTVGNVEGATFINATLVLGTFSVSRERAQSVRVRGLALEELPQHPLADQIDVMAIVYPEVSELRNGLLVGIPRRGAETLPTGLVFRYAGRRYLAEPGKPICDERQHPVTGLAAWGLSYLDHEMAIFSSSDGADVLVPAAGD